MADNENDVDENENDSDSSSGEDASPESTKQAEPPKKTSGFAAFGSTATKFVGFGGA